LQLFFQKNWSPRHGEHRDRKHREHKTHHEIAIAFEPLHSIGGFLAAHARAVLNLESTLGALVTLVIVAAACRRRNPGAETPTPQPVSRWVSWAGLPAIATLAVRALSGRAKITVMAAVLAFHFAALQHSIGPWLYASAKSQDACRAAAICIGGSAEGISTRDFPQALRGVSFIKNGFSTSVNRASLGLAMPHPAKGPIALSWDSAKDELICRVTPQ